MINIKSLSIGSHVSIDGKRVRVFGIGGNTIAYLPSIVSSACKEAKTEDVEPIAITAELLEELGFERQHNPFLDDYEKRWGGTDGFFEANYLSFHIIDDRWRMHSYEGSTCNGQTICRYLHEAEAFLSLHNVELINE